jgi:hypothetical protein
MDLHDIYLGFEAFAVVRFDEPSRHISRVSWLKITGISGAIFVMSHMSLVVGIGMVLETSVIFNQLTRLIPRERFLDIYLRCQVIIFVSVMISFYSW